MGNFNPKICRDDADFARGFAFLLETGREAGHSGPTVNVYRVMLRVVTYGGMILYEDEQGRIAGAACYTIGTEPAGFEDRHVLHVDYILMKPALQCTGYFLKCMVFFLDTVTARHPEAEVMIMEAAADAGRNNRLYSKFARMTGVIEGDGRKFHVYQTTLEEFSAYVGKLAGRSGRVIAG